MKLWTLLRGLPWGLPHVAADVHELRRQVSYETDRIGDVLAAVRKDRPPAPAFVFALAEGEVETPAVAPLMAPLLRRPKKWAKRPAPPTEWKRTTAGVAKLLERNENLELVTWRPMRDVRVIVFADLSRVSVLLFHGADLMHQAIGDCPIAYLPRWEVGVQVRVACNLRGSP